MDNKLAARVRIHLVKVWLILIIKIGLLRFINQFRCRVITAHKIIEASYYLAAKLFKSQRY